MYTVIQHTKKFSQIPVLRNRKKKRVITATFEPSTPLLSKKRSIRIENWIKHSFILIRHSTIFGAFFNHLFAYSNFSSIFNVTEIRRGKSDFVFAIFTRKSVFPLACTGNMNDFHLVPFVVVGHYD